MIVLPVKKQPPVAMGKTERAGEGMEVGEQVQSYGLGKKCGAWSSVDGERGPFRAIKELELLGCGD